MAAPTEYFSGRGGGVLLMQVKSSLPNLVITVLLSQQETSASPGRTSHNIITCFSPMLSLPSLVCITKPRSAPPVSGEGPFIPRGRSVDALLLVGAGRRLPFAWGPFFRLSQPPLHQIKLYVFLVVGGFFCWLFNRKFCSLETFVSWRIFLFAAISF